MFWVMLYMLLFGSSATPELAVVIPDKSDLYKIIKDPQKLAQVLAIQEKAKTTERLLTKRIENRYANLAELSLHYKRNEEQFRTVFDDLDSARLEAQSILLDERFRLREQLSRKEWEKVYVGR